MDEVRQNSYPRGAYVLAGETNDRRINSPEVKGHVADSSTEGGQERGHLARGELTVHASTSKGGRWAEPRSWGDP